MSDPVSETIQFNDLAMPIVVLLGLILNGIFLNRRLEQQKTDLTKQVEDHKQKLVEKIEEKKAQLSVDSDESKDIAKVRRELFFKLSNTSSMARSSVKAILNANRHPDKVEMIDVLILNLVKLSQCLRAINSDTSSMYLDKSDTKLFRILKDELIAFFFALDNKKFGDPEYIQGLTAISQRIDRIVGHLPTFTKSRLRKQAL